MALPFEAIGLEVRRAARSRALADVNSIAAPDCAKRVLRKTVSDLLILSHGLEDSVIAIDALPVELANEGAKERLVESNRNLCRLAEDLKKAMLVPLNYGFSIAEEFEAKESAKGLDPEVVAQIRKLQAKRKPEEEVPRSDGSAGRSDYKRRNPKIGTTCRACGLRDHWVGDAVCPMQFRGGYPTQRPPFAAQPNAQPPYAPPRPPPPVRPEAPALPAIGWQGFY